MTAMQVFATGKLAPEHRVMFWSKAVTRHLGNVASAERVSSPTLEDDARCWNVASRFQARIESAQVGNILFSRIVTNPHRMSILHKRMQEPLGPLVALQIAGHTTFKHNDTIAAIHPGDFIVLPRNLPLNSFEIIHDTRIEQLVLALPSHDCLPVGAARVKRISAELGVRKLFYAFTQDVFNALPYSSTAGEDIAQSLMTLLSHALLEPELPTAGRKTKPELLHQRMLQFIENHIGDHNLQVHAIATAANCSERTVHRVFSEHCGQTVKQYIWSRRLARSAEAIRQSRSELLSLTDIAYAHGFSSSAHFSRLFRHHYGMPPSQYLRR